MSADVHAIVTLPDDLFQEIDILVFLAQEPGAV
jgi:hypothetical protein